VSPLPITQISIFSLITPTLSTPTIYRYYNQGVFYIICKQLFCHWTCEFVIAKLHLQARTKREHQPS
jgi:hypothetical protein